MVIALLLLYFLTHIIPNSYHFSDSISHFLSCRNGNRDKIAYVCAVMRESVVERFPAYHLCEEPSLL